jgi:hypothetical protein
MTVLAKSDLPSVSSPAAESSHPTLQRISATPLADTVMDLLRDPPPDAEEDAWVSAASDRILTKFRERYGHLAGIQDESGVFLADQK